MTLKNVFIFTSDSKNGQLLELNAGAHSGYDCLNKEYGVDDTLIDKVTPHLSTKIDTHQICSITGYGKLASYIDRIEETFHFYPSLKGKNALFVRGFSLTGSVANAGDLFSKHYPQIVLDNNDSTVSKMYADKSFFFKMVEASNTKHTPNTKNYSLDSLSDNGTADFSEFSHVVIKPVDGMQGDGVMIVKGSDCQKAIQSLANKDFNTASMLANGNSSSAIRHWKDNPHHEVQLQEFVTAEPFAYKGKKWDATDRHLWSIIHTKDANGSDNFEVECYGAFKKLPLTSIDKQGDISQESSISASGVSILGKVVNLFTKENGSGEKVFTPEKDDMNREKISSDLLAIFKTALKYEQKPMTGSDNGYLPRNYLSLSQSSAGHMPITLNPQST